MRRIFTAPRAVGKPIRAPKDVPTIAQDIAHYGFDLTLPFTGVPSSRRRGRSRPSTVPAKPRDSISLWKVARVPEVLPWLSGSNPRT